MDFTMEEKLDLLTRYQPLIKKVVRFTCNAFDLNVEQMYDDLFQSASEFFLRHLSHIHVRSDIGKCERSMYNHLVRELRKMHVVAIPKHKFREKRNLYIQVPIEHAETIACGKTEEEIVSGVFVDDFLAGRPSNERRAIEMRLEFDSTNKEVMAVLGTSNEMSVTRFFRKMKSELEKYLDREGS